MRCGNLGDIGDEAEPSTVHGTDHRLSRAVVPRRLARGANATGNTGVGNRPPIPDRGDDLVLGDHPVAIAHQMDQQAQHLRLEVYGLTTAAELERLRIELEIAKCRSHPQSTAHSPPPAGN